METRRKEPSENPENEREKQSDVGEEKRAEIDSEKPVNLQRSQRS